MKTWGKLQPFQKTGTLLFQCASRPDLLPAKRPTELAFQLCSPFFLFLLQVLFSYQLLQDIDYSSLCYTAGPCCLSLLNAIVV